MAPHPESTGRPGIVDTVDAGVDEWKAVDADYPVLTVELLARLGRVRGHIERTLAPTYERHGLSAAEFYVLATLARRHDHTIAQSELGTALGLTPGTVSTRISQMTDRGLLVTSPGGDGRSRNVAAPDEALRRFEACQAELRFHQDRLFSALTLPQRHELATLLRRLGLDYETEADEGSRRYQPLGVALEPAHLARRRRAEVGLADRAGLLVTDTAPDHPLRVGDLIVAADGAPVVSILDLADAEPIDALTVLRGDDELEIEVGS